MQAILAKLALAATLLFGAWFLGYHTGSSHQKTVYVTAQAKANEIVVQKNDKMQDASNAEAQVQIVYKDRIVTKFQTVTKEVIKYEETPAATVFLDPEFIRLHNNAAAAHDEVQIAEPTSGTDGTATPTGVTTGEAIGVITRNYQNYFECKVKLEGWNRFYTNLQNTVNK